MAARASSSLLIPGGSRSGGGNRGTGGNGTRFAAGLAVAGAFLFTLAFPAVAEAQTFVSGSAEVQNEQVERPQGDVAAQPGAEVLGVSAERGLAATGTEVVGLGVAGAAAIAAGGVMLAARRRNNKPAR